MASRARQALALVRIGVGLDFLASGIGKLANGWLVTPSPLVDGSLGPALQGGQVDSFYRPWLENIVIPHGLLFSQLTVLGEIGVGLSLLLGLLTRVGGVVGIWLNLNYMLMKGLGNVSGSEDRVFILIELALVIGAAGLVWGIDGLLQRRHAQPPLVRLVAGDETAEKEPPTAAAA